MFHLEIAEPVFPRILRMEILRYLELCARCTAWLQNQISTVERGSLDPSMFLDSYGQQRMHRQPEGSNGTLAFNTFDANTSSHRLD